MTAAGLGHSPMFADAAVPIAEPPRSMPADVARAYRHYVESHWGEIDVPELATVMFAVGGRTALAASVQFSDIVPQLNRIEARVRALLELLEAFGE